MLSKMKNDFQISYIVQLEKLWEPLLRKGNWKTTAWEGEMARLLCTVWFEGPLGNPKMLSG